MNVIPANLGVRCDTTGCDETLQGDFWVRDTDDRDTRLGVVLDHAEKQGWSIYGRDHPSTAASFCPDHA